MSGPAVFIPRAGTSSSTTGPPQSPVPGPKESEFIAEFGALLPPAHYLTSENGSFAYYDLPPREPSGNMPIQRFILVHGIGTPALGMLPLAKAIQASNGYAHVVLYDHYGHGLSSTPIVPHEAALFHSQILQILQQFKWPSANLLGFSFGGTTATSFTALHPECVQSLVLIAPVGLFRFKSFPEHGQRFITGGPDVNEQEAQDWIVDFVSGGPLKPAPDWREQFARGEINRDAIQVWARKFHKGHLSSVVAMFRDGGVADTHHNFETVSKSGMKRIAVLGELDDVCTEQDLKDVGFEDVIVVPGAGHGVVRDHVPEIMAPLIPFWKSCQ